MCISCRILQSGRAFNERAVNHPAVASSAAYIWHLTCVMMPHAGNVRPPGAGCGAERPHL